jgi:hypothetical protein
MKCKTLRITEHLVKNSTIVIDVGEIVEVTFPASIINFDDQIDPEEVIIQAQYKKQTVYFKAKDIVGIS